MYKVNASDLDINGTGLDIPLERLISEVNATLGEDFSLADIK